MPALNYFRIIRSVFLTGLLTAIYSVSLSQEIRLSTLSEQEPVTLSGSFATSQILNLKWPSAEDGNLFSGYCSGNIAVNIYGISVPLSFTYSNRKTNFTHPFNQYGIHPSYKWLKTHIGYSSISFTPYTLNGHLFYGGALEIDPPGVFSAKLMGGRLKKAVEPDSSGISGTTSYERTGIGARIGLGSPDNNFSINLFIAGDKENSIVNDLPLAPGNNSVMSVSFKKKLLKHLSVQGEYASSYFTSDSRLEGTNIRKNINNIPGWFIPYNETTIASSAVKASLTYNHPLFSLGTGYEKVDPGYQTFGSYYFTNNMENMTVNGSFGIFDNQLSFSASTGLQKEVPEESRITGNNRFVGSANMTIRAGERLNLSVAFSNFTSYTNLRSDFDYINETDIFSNYDTLNYRQISRNTTITGNFRPVSPEGKDQNLSISFVWQQSDEEIGTDESTKTDFYNAGASYGLTFREIGLSVNSSFNFNLNETPIGTNNTMGPMIGFSKMFFNETLKSSLTGSYNVSKNNGELLSSVFNTRLNTGFSINKRHSFTLSALLRNNSYNDSVTTQLNITMGYMWSL